MRLRYIAVSLLCLAAANAGAQAGRKAQAGKSPELRVDYTKETLPNGLNVIYHVDHSTPVAAVLLWYNVGSKVEQPGKTGFAHLFEHMMFQGSKNVGKGQHFALLEAAGGRAAPTSMEQQIGIAPTISSSCRRISSSSHSGSRPIA